MINDTFYPTPKEVIDQMLEPLRKPMHGGYHLGCYRILEPSAGKGDIIDRLINRYDVKRTEVMCIESDPELQLVLTGKGYKLIDTDFLTFNEPYSFDLIVMNPPFVNGDDHLLKAWNILKTGQIVCLLNAETVLNPYTKERKLLTEIIEKHGSYKVIGSAFAKGERPTDVEVVIVWLKKETATLDDLDFGDDLETEARATEEAFTANPLASRNMVQSLVAQYTQAAQVLVDIHRLQAKYRFYTAQIVSSRSEADRADMTLNEQIAELKAEFWRYVFAKTKLGQQTTSNFQRKFDEFQTQTSNLAFSEANIMRILEMFFLNRDQIMKDCIVAAFDDATGFHEKNKIHVEGWKTNKSWRVAPKIIVPYGLSYEAKFDWWSTSHYRMQFFSDLDKALCFIAGKDITTILPTATAIEQHIAGLRQGARYDVLFSSTYFDIRIFKKGTVHLIFRDDHLLNEFNRIAAENKNWLGGGY